MEKKAFINQNLCDGSPKCPAKTKCPQNAIEQEGKAGVFGIFGKALLKINIEKCTGCMICNDFCARGAISQRIAFSAVPAEEAGLENL